MTPAETALLVAAGLASGAINGMAGGGSLVSYPALLATGHGALVANVTNTVGQLPGYVGGAAGFGDHLRSQRHRVRELAPVTVGGGVLGALLLLATPAGAFDVIAPILILAACGLFAAQPKLQQVVVGRRHEDHDPTGPVPRAAAVGVFLTAVYGGYFGAGIGVILLAVLGTVLIDPLPSINSLRGVLSLAINGVAAVVFCIGADVHWAAAGALAAGSLVGGYLGARASLRLPVPALRAVVLTFGLVAAAKLVFW